MIQIHDTNHAPYICAQAIAGADMVVLDLETTGTTQRHDRIVAAGVLVGHTAHILLTDAHNDISSSPYRVSQEELQLALAPLATRPDLVVVMHNAIFDTTMLEHAGIPVNCIIHDTWKLLKLADSDRGPEGDDDDAGTGTQLPRTERRFNESLNYKLKSLAKHLLDINAIDFPGAVAALPMDELVRYLKSDLLVTHELYEFLRH